jgi:hypothetical protein
MQLSYRSSLLKKSFKLLPVFILIYIIYDLTKNDKLSFSVDFLLDQELTIERLAILLTVVLLMYLNWFMEARKWQLLTKDYYYLNFKSAFKAVLSGITTALFTPNRVGDFIGKVSHLPQEHRKKGMISSFFGSYSQWLLTIIMGWIAWIQLGRQIINADLFYSLISLVYFIMIVGLLILFLRKGPSIKAFKRFKKFFKHPPSVNSRLRLIGLSFLRYFIFTSQFYLLLHFFGVDLNYGLVLSKLGLFYLISSLIPSTFWGELGIKESLAVWVFSGIVINSLLIITTTLLLWFINLFVPAIFGNYFLYKKTKVYS